MAKYFIILTGCFVGQFVFDKASYTIFGLNLAIYAIQ